MFMDGIQATRNLKWELRNLEYNDIQDILHLLQQLSKYSPTSIEPAEFEAYINQTLETVVAVTPDGKILGFGSIMFYKKLRGGLQGYLEDIVIHSDYQNQGIGSAVVKDLVAKARDRGAYRVVLSCIDSNSEFYERNGFTAVERTMKQLIDHDGNNG
jgi:ribosomal protein S18 acetylase RimI-like enzyme